MSLLFYSTSAKGPGERLHRVIEVLVPKREIEIFRTIESLTRRLHRPGLGHNMTIAVFLAASKEELSELVSIRNLLADLRIILVLADAQGDTIAKGHTLRPRFLTDVDSDFLDIVAVLGKMLSSADSDTGSSKDVCEAMSNLN
ncbi:MAG: hypothetical protein IMF18_10615 [Proteobacteria bacterium]|nr:hypothetical protein [Pseudomonadota bacterium]